LGLSDGPWYVSELRAETNTVVVARKNELGKRFFSIDRPHWFKPLPERFKATVKVRYNSTEIPCRIERSGETRVELLENHVLSPGQSAVVYDDDVVIGGGIIKRGT